MADEEASGACLKGRAEVVVAVEAFAGGGEEEGAGGEAAGVGSEAEEGVGDGAFEVAAGRRRDVVELKRNGDLREGCCHQRCSSAARASSRSSKGVRTPFTS